MRIRQLTIAVSMVALVAACAKKAEPAAPPVAPPQPAQTQETQPAPPPVDTGAATSAIRPGSLEDLIDKVGTDRVFFAYDSSDLDGTAQDTLRKEADWLKANNTVRITIEGHCDERGTREYNLALGDRRAEAVKSYLVSLGVPAGRVVTISYGKERPEAVGSDDVSWAKNRRGVTVVN